MEKYNLRLKEKMNSKIQEILCENHITIKYIDRILDDLVIVETNNESILSKLDFVKSFKRTRIGELLDTTRQPKKQAMKVNPMPDLQLNVLRDNGLYGLGNKVAIIDSGHDLDLCGDVEKSISYTDRYTYDNIGHGSLVISLVKKIIPAVKIYSAKVCEEKDKVDEEYVIRALDWIYHDLPDVEIINMSIGLDANCLGDCDLADKVNFMANQGYKIIVAMGNKGNSNAHCPACATDSISVGALDKSGNKVASFSSKGHINTTKPDIVASGHGDQYISGKPHSYYGTSFAAPVITGFLGATSHMFKENINVKEYLIQSSEKLAGEPITRQGSGKVNLQKLLEAVENEKDEAKT